jgi:hypothetical protein
MLKLKLTEEVCKLRTFSSGVLTAASLVVLAQTQPDPQTGLWAGLKKQLSSSNGESYFEANVKDAVLPPLKGRLVSVLINEGVSRAIIKMPGSEEADVTLWSHNGSATLRAKPIPGQSIEFSGVAVAFSTVPFMVTFDVNVGNLRGLEFVRPASKSGRREG